MEYQTSYALICIENPHRIVWIDSKLEAKGTKSIVSVDKDVS